MWSEELHLASNEAVLIQVNCVVLHNKFTPTTTTTTATNLVHQSASAHTTRLIQSPESVGVSNLDERVGVMTNLIISIIESEVEVSR